MAEVAGHSEGGIVELIPAVYRCGEDDQDLTALVRQELEESVPASFTRRGTDSFRVVVTCPGGPTAHQVALAGRLVDHR